MSGNLYKLDIGIYRNYSVEFDESVINPKTDSMHLEHIILKLNSRNVLFLFYLFVCLRFCHQYFSVTVSSVTVLFILIETNTKFSNYVA